MIIFLIIFVLVFSLLGGGIWFLLRGYPTLSFQDHDHNFEIRYAHDVPYLWSDGLPYPTDVDASNRLKHNLNGVWKMQLDPREIGEHEQWYASEIADEAWREVRIPSTINIDGSAERDYEGVLWFRLRFNAPFPLSQSELLRLCFQGVGLRSKIWLNGLLLGEREGGYTPFFFNITDLFRPDTENLLVVKADNRLTYTSLPPKTWKGHNSAWWPYAGIYRDVYLEKLPTHYIFKIMAVPCIQTDNTTCELTVLTHRLSDEQRSYTLTCQLWDKAGRLAGEHTFQCRNSEQIAAHRCTLAIAEPQLWSERTPTLYTLIITLKSQEPSTESHPDQVSCKIGLRSIAVQGASILLNDTPVFLRGIAKMEDDPLSGATQTEAGLDRDLTRIQEMNANFIRLAHYPHDRKELQRVRELGIMVSEEIPLYHAGIGWILWHLDHGALRDFPFHSFGMRQLGDPAFLQNAKRQLIELIERDRNNPAVILWMLSNESYSFLHDAGQVYRWLTEIVREFDPTRPVSCTELIYPFRPVDRLRASSQYMDVIGLNTYYGWYYGKAQDIEHHVEAYHSLHPDKPILITEFGAGAVRDRTDQDGEWRAERVPPGRTYSESYQAQIMKTYLELLPAKKFVAGLIPWVFADFSSHWFPSNPIPNYNCKGVLTRERQPKLAYFFLQQAYQLLKYRLL